LEDAEVVIINNEDDDYYSSKCKDYSDNVPKTLQGYLKQP